MDAKQILKSLSIEKKLGLLTGYDNFSALKINDEPLIRMADGPNGVKTADGDSLCFPNTCLMASSFDKELCFEIGKMLGIEARRHGVNLLLAPNVNIKRNPLAGRNFESYSEDPFVTGALALEFIKGIKSKKVGACIKHYACNNQEHLRWIQNSVIDDDTLRNVYLKAFEMVINGTDVDFVMTAYNKVNGKQCCENEYLLKTILRDEWGYKGAVVSDWASIGDVVQALKNGLDIEMPCNYELTYPKLYKAYASGELTEQEIDEKLTRLIEFYNGISHDTNFNEEIDEQKLRKFTGESFILLKNDGVLPLKSDEKVLIVGSSAENPRIQGGGCANIKTKTILRATDEIMKQTVNAEYVSDYELCGITASDLKSYDKIVVFLSLDFGSDSEAYDRTDLSFPIQQITAVKKIAKHNPNVIAVLSNGSAVDLSFDKYTKAVLETYYAGSLGAGAIADVLYGKTTPSGKLAETFPLSVSDVPSYNFACGEDVNYAEREFVGYRYYTTYGVKTKYPFGYGLSYCKFNIDNVKIDGSGYDYEVSFDITNNSKYDGKETVQIYLGDESRFAPKKQLIEFITTRVKAGEKKSCKAKIGASSFSRYLNGTKKLLVGKFKIIVATSSEHEIFSKDIELNKDSFAPISRETLIGELMKVDRYREIAKKYLLKAINLWAFGDENSDKNFEDDEFLRNHAYGMPIRGIAYFSLGKLTDETIKQLILELNNA